jgi:hypothetical protein
VNIAIDNSVASGEVQRGFDQAGFKGQDNLGDMQVQE